MNALTAKLAEMNHTEATIVLAEINKLLEVLDDNEEIDQLLDHAAEAEAELMRPTTATATYDENDMAWMLLTDRTVWELDADMDAAVDGQFGGDLTRYFDTRDALADELRFLWAHEALKENKRIADEQFNEGFDAAREGRW